MHRTFVSAAVVGAALGFGASVLPSAGPASGSSSRASGPESKEAVLVREAGPASGERVSRRSPVVDVVARVRPAVVNIHSERSVHGPSAEELFALAPSQHRVNGMGTGIIIDPRGYLVTNQHVIDEVTLIRVRLHDGTAHSARVVARSPEADLALLKIDTSRPLFTMPLGTADDLMVGETVIAIGNAYGYEHTVSVGVVSAIKRDVTLNKDVSYKALIQTDASINPGNSGGPLLNIHGELIGVNVAIRAGAQGIGFAIPVDSVLRVGADLMSIRKRNGTWHGLVYRDSVGEAEAEAEMEGEKTKNGSPLRISKTSMPVSAGRPLARRLVVEAAESQSPAARAGLQRGDVVLQAGDAPISCALELERALLDRPAGARVPLVVRRRGQEERLELVLQPVGPSPVTPAELVWRKLGLRLNPVPAEVVSRSDANLHGGLAVVEVSPNGLAGKAGIVRSDILIGLHNFETLSLDNVVYVITHPDLASFQPLRFWIIRSGTIHRGWLQ
jgi:serine protease Do